MKKDKPYDKTVYQSLTMITQFGINMLVPIGLMTALGIYADGYLKTGWLTIVMFFIGAIAGGQNVYRMAKGIFSKEDAGEADKRAEKKE